MIAGLFLLAASVFGAVSHWQGSVLLDTLAIVKAKDTLRIEGPCRIQARKPSAGILVRGTLLVAGDDSSRVEWSGGKGIEVSKGASAYFAGFELADAVDGIHVSGGQATVWESSLQAKPGRSAATLSSGVLVIAGSRITGRSPALLGRQGSLELDDVVLKSDTLWNLDPAVATRFQDLDASDGVRMGQNPPELGSHVGNKGSGSNLRWAIGPSFGTRVGNNDRRDVVAVPLRLSMDLGSRFTANLLCGWRSGWIDRNWAFNERDQTLARLQARILPFLDLAVEAGYGGEPIEWNRPKAEMAVALLDRSMDLDEPFVAPGPLAGGRASLHGRPFGEADAAFGVGYQWRGSSGATNLGDVLASWGSIAMTGAGRRTEFASSGVWCLPDRIQGVAQLDRWQWNAVLDHRQNLTDLEWGLDLSIEGLDGGLFGQRIYGDLLWGGPALRYGPVFSGLLTETDGGWGMATGPGVRWRYVPSANLRIDVGGFVRVHRDVLGETWLGSDCLARISGGF